MTSCRGTGDGGDAGGPLPQETVTSGVHVRPPLGAARPFVASIPHGSDLIPERFASQMLLTEGLRSDAYTPEVYGFVAELGATVVEAALSRYVADPNRDLAAPTFGPFPRGIVASTDGWRPLYAADLAPDAVAERIAVAHTAYHRALDDALATHLAATDRVLLLDLHSFGVPLDTDVVLGDAHGSTAAGEVVMLLEAALADAGFRVTRNRRFTGGWIVRRFAGVAAVDAVQVEVNKRLYADEAAVADRRRQVPRDADRIGALRARLRAAFGQALGAYEAWIG